MKLHPLFIFAAEVRRIGLPDPARSIAEGALARVERAADRREARVAARGQLRLLDPGPRTYPALPVLRRRRRRAAAHVAAST
jgi:hypothetical protein